ncbi:MAG: LuxR C-terminal-related transcriptional regulator [Streptosporangiaceae bacterium]|jgi:LuxR family maltose regulon positive regulatory protein
MRKEWVQRPRLLEELARAVSAKLVLVDAPAGFGKTTLVAQWRASAIERRRFAWVSLDSGDDDPGRLWWHVVSALERACPELDAEDLLRALRTQAPQIGDDVIPGLANRLARLRAPVVLVLDDYHVIKERSCHDQMASLLLHLPPAVQLVLITRADPRLPLARLRTTGEMVEIRMPELRFGPLQAAALVHAVSGAGLSAADLADLVERTEGWPAGLYLAALSLRGHPAPGAFVRQFTGNNRFVVDFLAEEVLTRQPAEIRQFLARTSILGRFCAPLCDAVAGSGNGADVLDVLERENLFVVPLDETRGWYRYHHLFAQVLRSELARAEPGTVPALHQRASAWYLASGWVEEAISHALAAGDIPGSVDLIARNWHAYVSVGRAGTVRAWMRLFTDDQIAAHPLAAHCAAWAAALSGEPEPLRRWLPVIEASHLPGQLPDGLVSLEASAALLRGVYGFEGLRVMRESARQAAGLETDPGSPWYALARAAYGFSLYLSGDLEAAQAELEDAARSEWCATLIGILALSTLSLIAVERGDIPRAEGLADTARGLASRDDLSEAPQGALAYTATGTVRAAQGRFHEARAEFEHAVWSRRRKPGMSPWATLEGMLRLAQVLLDLGQRAEARELTEEAQDVLAEFPEGVEVLQARLEGLRRQLAAPLRVAGRGSELTEREVAVLRLLRGTLSLREISVELYVSPNTVKTHAQAIYRKLGVSTRHDAVARGREAGVLLDLDHRET